MNPRLQRKSQFGVFNTLLQQMKLEYHNDKAIQILYLSSKIIPDTLLWYIKIHDPRSPAKTSAVKKIQLVFIKSMIFIS